MPSISANTLITLPARQLLIFSSGGTGAAQVSGITGGPVSYVVGLYESYVGPYDRETSVYVTGSVWPITYTIDTDGVLPTLNDLAVRLTAVEASGGGGGVADDAVTNAKLANVATATIKGRATAGTGDPEDLTATQVRTLLNVANGATANSSDATLLARANHTGTQALSTLATQAANTVVANATAGAASPTAIALAASQLFGRGATGNLAPIVLGTNLSMSGTTLNAAGGATNLSYTAATRVIASDTGTDATLPLVSSTDAGLAPASGGGTTNYLRADGTWAAPAGGGTVTSVGMSVPTGLSVSGSPVTGSGTLAVTLTAGYVIPTQATLDDKLSSSAATTISATKAVLVAADKLISFDSAASDVPKLTTLGELNNSLGRIAPGTGLGTTGTVNLDLAALAGTDQQITATGNITFTTSNRAAGLRGRLRIAAGGSTRTLTWPSWTAFGAVLPTSLASGKVLRVAWECTGTTDASVDVVAVESV